MRKRLSSDQKWFLRPYFPLIRSMFLLRSGLRFSFRALERLDWRNCMYQIYLVLILFLFYSQISNNARGYKIKTSWLLCSVLSPNANTSPFPIVYPPITRKTIDNFFFSNLTALLQAMYFGGDSIKQVLFFMGAYILLISCPFVKVKTKQKSKYLKCLHPHNGIKSGDNLGRRSGPVN